ncbi:sulfur carrier protein ThiS [Desulfosarcina sp. OttesenSCG-928-A07]|nr:sulfur carrier protein ThiS [Desulfosarcina sp. OttesenSCG-928-G17]MDL2328708.1 sulfur carrier protein ThiS [Desulfosarcina sp. OttesenSCG-928-A07]
MKIVLNGQETEIQSPTLAELIISENLDPSSLVAEHNGRIVTSSEWDTVFLREKDKVELLRFVGGG